ncbi:MAG TPA: hypothetical protein VGS09_07770 [Actinomycetota bacterium]|jgi:hypothetical protein|nr:hypothetical protein [Actinomycetota bacterium]
MTDLLLPAAALGPAAAGVVWVALAAWRWPQRAAGALVALAAHAAAWAVLWLAYRGESPAWRSLEATLLGASVLVATELALLLVALRAEGLGRRGALGVGAALGVSATAVAFASFSTSLVVQALFLPAVTLAAALAGLSGTGRRDVAGVLGLAAADVACLAGLAIWVSRLGSVVVAPTGSLDLGGALVLAGAAIKAGAVPGQGTWRLAATGGPGAPVTAALRGQGIALAVLAGVVVSGSDGSLVVASIAAAAGLAGGIAAAVSAHRGGRLAGMAGAAACVPFLALGLGGAVGARAFLLSFPPFLLASGAAFAAGWPGPETVDPPPRGEGGEGTAGRLRRWIGVPAALGAVVSLAALPGGGGHPGAALALDLAGVRAQTEVLYLGVAAALMLGLGMAAVAAAPVVAAARPPIPAGLASLVTGAALVYMGSQPVRLGIGWWLRIERALQVPGLLPSAGAPSFPAARGIDLTLALVPAAGVALLIAVLGRGVRPGPAEVGPIRPPRARVPVPASASGAETITGRVMAVSRRARVIARAVAGRSAQLRGRAHRMALGLAVAALLEGGAVALSVFLVMEGVRLGFL